MQSPIPKTVNKALNALTAAPAPSTKVSNSLPDPSQRVDWLQWDARTQEMRNFEKFVREYHAALMAGSNPRWLTMVGQAGCGKTHCAKALWAEVKKRLDWNPQHCACIPRFVYWPKFVGELRAGDGFDLLRDMQRWPFLFLDDIGAERDATGFATEALNTLLGCRTGKWTVLTSNLGAIEWTKTEPRIASRMVRDGSRLLQAPFGPYTPKNGT